MNKSIITLLQHSIAIMFVLGQFFIQPTYACAVCSQTDPELRKYFENMEDLISLVKNSVGVNEAESSYLQQVPSAVNLLDPWYINQESKNFSYGDIGYASDAPIGRDWQHFATLQSDLAELDASMKDEDVNTIEVLSSDIRNDINRITTNMNFINISVNAGATSQDMVSMLMLIHAYHTLLFLSLVPNAERTESAQETFDRGNTSIQFIAAQFEDYSTSAQIKGEHFDAVDQLQTNYACAQSYQSACNEKLDNLAENTASIGEVLLPLRNRAQSEFEDSALRMGEEMRDVDGGMTIASNLQERKEELYEQMGGFLKEEIYAVVGPTVHGALEDMAYYSTALVRDIVYGVDANAFAWMQSRSQGVSRQPYQTQFSAALYHELRGSMTDTVRDHTQQAITVASIDIQDTTARYPLLGGQLTLNDEMIGTPDKPKTIVGFLGQACEMQCVNAGARTCWYKDPLDGFEEQNEMFMS